MFEGISMLNQHRILNAVADLIDTGSIHLNRLNMLGQIDAEHLKMAHTWWNKVKSDGKLVLEDF
jgi:hypothetical protein